MQAGSTQSTAPALWPAHSQGHASAAAMLPLKCSPQSFTLLEFYFSYPSLQLQTSPDKLQCRKQIQAVIPEGTGPVKTLSDPSEALPFLAEPSTGADAETQPRPAVSETTGAASSVLSTKII